MADGPETKFYHNAALAISSVLLAVIFWIGTNVAHIPVIDEQIHELREELQENVTKRINDHEGRIRKLEGTTP